MSKALVVCYRKTKGKENNIFLHEITKRLEPDNATINKPYIWTDSKITTLIYNPSLTIKKDGASICLGKSNEPDNLFVPKAKIPKGSFALFRVGEKAIEIATDYAASRTLWYYCDSDLFMASSSQRMMVAFLGNFNFNTKACAWFLSSGTLGPKQSWDKRFKIIPPRTSLFLDRIDWGVTMSYGDKFGFALGEVIKKDNDSYRNQLKLSVESSISELNINAKNWTLALSGGMDRRSLLYYLKNPKLNSVTWGLKESLKYSNSDARIGARLASECKIGHFYAKTDYKEDSFPLILNRFLCAGEGRIDHLAGYLDGLDTWAKLSSSGRGLIRGYDAFGRKPPVVNDYQVKRTCNLTVSYFLHQYFEKSLLVKEKDIPEDLNKMENETMEDWRDRLWLQHRTPTTTAALEDIKLAYVEVINPLLSEQVIREVQHLPVELRANKKVWKEIVTIMFPNIPIAKRESTQDVEEVLNRPDVKKYICDKLLMFEEPKLFSEEFIHFITANYSNDSKKELLKQGVKKLIIAYLPKRIENHIRKNIKPSAVSNQWLAVRVLMVLKIREMYYLDAQIRKA